MNEMAVILDAWDDYKCEVAIKQAGLLFDKVLFVPSIAFTLRDGVIDRFCEVGDGYGYIKDFSWFNDLEVTVSIPPSSMRTGVGKLLAALEDRGVARPAAYAPGVPWILGEHWAELRSTIGSVDLLDSAWVDRVGSTAELKSGKINILSVQLQSSAGSREVLWVNAPRAVGQSWSLSDLAMSASISGASPVCCRADEIALFDKRMDRYRAFLKSGGRASREAAQLARKAGRGAGLAAAFELLAPSRVVGEMSADDVVAARKEFAQARKDLLVNYIVELEDLLAETPAELRHEACRTFRKEKLDPAMVRFAGEQADFRDRWFGTAVAQSAKVARTSILAGGSAGVVATQIPFGGIVLPFAIGLGAGLASQGPAIVSSLVECVNEHRRLRRSAMAYVLRLGGSV